MKILCCSDIHIGRIPSVSSVDEINGSSAWNAIVNTALSEEVDVLVLSGDIVDQDDAWYEAYGPLIKNLNLLGEQGIQVIAVAGNHDSHVFPLLAKENPHVKILGLQSRWEAFDYQEVRFLGWSFSHAHCKEDPFDSFDRALLDTPYPVLGLLHCDVDGQKGPRQYAPVPSYRFSSLANSFWILGHIHASRVKENYLYCGSPFALDSSEEGLHGVWVLEVEEKRHKRPQMLPLSPFRFERCAVPLTGDVDEEQLRKATMEAVKAIAIKVGEEGFSGRLFLKLIFTGVVSPHVSLNALIQPQYLQVWEFPVIGAVEIILLGDFEDTTEVELDLVSLSKGVGPKAQLAALLCDLESHEELIQQIAELENESKNCSAFSLVGDMPPSEETTTPQEILYRAGMELLRTILVQGR